jgi:hypothetical protein
MQAVGLRLQTIKSTQAMTDAMKGASRAMKSMNAQVDAASMAKILKDFEQESALMDDKQEMMDGTFAALADFPLPPPHLFFFAPPPRATRASTCCLHAPPAVVSAVAGRFFLLTWGLFS